MKHEAPNAIQLLQLTVTIPYVNHCTICLESRLLFGCNYYSSTAHLFFSG